MAPEPGLALPQAWLERETESMGLNTISIDLEPKNTTLASAKYQALMRSNGPNSQQLKRPIKTDSINLHADLKLQAH
jgi:hypothetical protein